MNAEERYLVVLNPTAGRGRAMTSWPDVRGRMRRAGIVFDEAVTRASGHARDLAAGAETKGYTAVVAVGGDGTVQEVASGLMDSAELGARPALGVLPLGNGNDFAKLAGLPRPGIAAAVDGLRAPRRRRIDVGRMGDRYFMNGVGIGFDARVGVEAAKITWLRGMPMYGAALLRVLGDHQTPHMTVEMDGEVVMERKLTLVTIGNGGCHGGGFWLCPDAKIDDGVFDICIADALSPLRMLGLLPKVMRGTHTRLDCVTMRRARRVRVVSAAPVPVHADGEIVSIDATEVEAELLPGSLELLAPAGS